MLTGWYDIDRAFSMMDEVRSRMDQLLQEYDTGRKTSGYGTTVWPRVNLFDTGESLLLRAEIPGVAPEDLNISASQEGINLSGERKTEMPEGYALHRQERSPLRFSRSFTFPVKVDADHISAEMKNGILTITLPKAPEVKPRAINVKIV